MKVDKEKFDIQFIERTQNLITNYEGDIEFTLLLNCLLGLILVPIEFNRMNGLKYFNEKIKDVVIYNKLLEDGSIKRFNPTHYNSRKDRYVKSTKTFGCFLRKIRNSIAHISNSEPHSDSESWHSITLRDKNIKNNNNIELEIKLSYENIRDLAEYISTKYKSEVEGTPTDNTMYDSISTPTS